MRLFFNSLSFRIGITIVLIQVAIFLIFGYFYINSFFYEIDEQLMQNVQHPGQLMNTGLLEFAVVSDRDAMQQIVGEQLIEGFVAGVNQRIFFASNADYLGESIADMPEIEGSLFDVQTNTEGIILEDKDSITSVIPILGADGQTTQFFVYTKLSTELAQLQKREIIRQLILGFTVTILTISIVLYFAFQQIILKAINHILSILKEVEEGNLSARLNFRYTNGEFGIIQASLNTTIGELETIVNSLEERVQVRTFKLSKAIEQLKELDQSKTQFISDVTHELRTPVTTLMTRIYVMKHHSKEQLEKDMGVLDSQIKRLAQLIEDVLDISRMDMNHRELEKIHIDLNTVVQPIIDSLSYNAEQKGLRFNYEPHSEAIMVFGESNQLSRVGTNLIANAIKYTKGGEVNVRTMLDENNEHVILSIQDTGIGISEEDLPKIFDRFYRSRDVAQSTIPGTGLGLGIVDEIVKLHDGKIIVESELGVGSEFKVLLPLSQR